MNEIVTINQNKIMIRYKKILLTLVALFAMTAGAWAEEVIPETLDFTSNSWGIPEGTEGKTAVENSYTSGGYTITLCGSSGNGYYFSLTEPYILLGKQGAYLQLPAFSSAVDSIHVVGTSGASTAVEQNIYVGDVAVSTATTGMKNVTQKYVINENYRTAGTIYRIKVTSANNTQIKKVLVYFTPADPNAIEVTPVAGKTNEWTFTMPAYDVEIAPIYAPAAQWAKVENVDQLPTAIEGIFAGTTDAIVKAGTVAMMGKTENPQGTVMYAVTSTNQATAPELSAFSATVPTAENIADEGADVLVWYYIQGANTPDGQEATAENTFNDSEICETPIKVTVLPNKYDIQFNAANDNTIEAGKATVTVGGTAATVTEGKLQGVKMGSEVKMTAKDGYKFRKVEAKKKAVPVSLTYATKEGAVTRIKFNYGGNVYYADFTYSNGSFTRTGGSNGYTFSGSWTMKEENGVLTMTANYNEMNEQFIYFVCTFYADTNEYTAKSAGSWNYSFGGIEVNGTDITSQLTEVK